MDMDSSRNIMNKELQIANKGRSSSCGGGGGGGGDMGLTTQCKEKGCYEMLQNA
jgi:hypothetical protein